MKVMDQLDGEMRFLHSLCPPFSLKCKQATTGHHFCMLHDHSDQDKSSLVNNLLTSTFFAFGADENSLTAS